MEIEIQMQMFNSFTYAILAIAKSIDHIYTTTVGGQRNHLRPKVAVNAD
jgi:hypothetical protein